MQRVTLTLDDELVAEIDAFIKQRHYNNRSEAVRDLVRDALHRGRGHESQVGPVVAALVYVFDHGARELPRRLTGRFHDHHALTLSTLHVHLDHDQCLEVAVLRGDGEHIRDFADSVIAERGVRHGNLVTIPQTSD